MKINGPALIAGLGLVETIVPQVFAAEQVLRAVWSMAHPDKSEAEYLAYLDSKADKLIADSDGILISFGYVRDAVTGKWAKPTV